MKPGDHPDFFRYAPPPGTSRESTIVLSREGRFSHDGDPIDHEALERALSKWIAKHPDDGRLILENGYDWCYFRAEDAPFTVRALRVEGDRATVQLSDESEEPLDPETLTVGEGGVVYAKVKGRGFDARFSRFAQTALAPLLIEADPPRIQLAGRTYALGVRAAQ